MDPSTLDETSLSPDEENGKARDRARVAVKDVVPRRTVCRVKQPCPVIPERASRDDKRPVGAERHGIHRATQRRSAPTNCAIRGVPHVQIAILVTGCEEIAVRTVREGLHRRVQPLEPLRIPQGRRIKRLDIHGAPYGDFRTVRTPGHCRQLPQLGVHREEIARFSPEAEDLAGDGRRGVSARAAGDAKHRRIMRERGDGHINRWLRAIVVTPDFRRHIGTAGDDSLLAGDKGDAVHRTGVPGKPHLQRTGAKLPDLHHVVPATRYGKQATRFVCERREALYGHSIVHTRNGVGENLGGVIPHTDGAVGAARYKNVAGGAQREAVDVRPVARKGPDRASARGGVYGYRVENRAAHEEMVVVNAEQQRTHRIPMGDERQWLTARDHAPDGDIALVAASGDSAIGAEGEAHDGAGQTRKLARSHRCGNVIHPHTAHAGADCQLGAIRAERDREHRTAIRSHERLEQRIAVRAPQNNRAVAAARRNAADTCRDRVHGAGMPRDRFERHVFHDRVRKSG